MSEASMVVTDGETTITRRGSFTEQQTRELSELDWDLRARLGVTWQTATSVRFRVTEKGRPVIAVGKTLYFRDHEGGIASARPSEDGVAFAVLPEPAPAT